MAEACPEYQARAGGFWSFGSTAPTLTPEVKSARVYDDTPNRIPRVDPQRFVRSSGPGGQNVNKVATAVELRFDVRASSLPADVKTRLIALAGNRIVADGVLLIDSRVFRSQAQNREAARARLMALVQKAMKAPKRRKATRPRAGAREERLTTKKKRSAVKQLRGRGGRGDE